MATVYLTLDAERVWTASVPVGSHDEKAVPFCEEKGYPVEMYYLRTDINGSGIVESETYQNRYSLIEGLNWLGKCGFTPLKLWDFDAETCQDGQVMGIFGAGVSRRYEAAQESLEDMFSPNGPFYDNEELAFALFLHLKKTGQITGTEYDRETILHDINNLRGHEWLESLERNLETKPFFDCMPHADWAADEFAYGHAVEPDVLLKAVFGDNCPDVSSFDDIREFLDANGYDHLWDYSPDDLDEAINNLSEDMWLLGVAFYEKDGCSIRIFEIEDEMAKRLDCMLVVTERGDCVLPTHVAAGDVVVGPYIQSTEQQADVSEREMAAMGDRAASKMVVAAGKAMADLDAQIRFASSAKEYKLTLFRGEEDEEIVHAVLTDEQVAIIKTDMAGELNAAYNITLVDGSTLEVGCIDAIETAESAELGQKQREAYSDVGSTRPGQAR